MTQGEEQLYDKREVDTDHVKCAGCGANMEFDPASQKLVCRHCGRTEELEKQFGAPELDYLKGLDACLPSTRMPPCSGAKPGRKRDGWRRANSESACLPTA